jgi:hypothetical protein
VAFLVLAAVGLAGGENVPLHRVPRPVLDAVRARFPAARIAGADAAVEDGQPIYEVSIKDRGTPIDVTVTPEGALLLIKTQITAPAVPAPVKRALEARYPGSVPRVVEEVITVQSGHEKLAHYEVELVTAQGRIREVRVSGVGKVLEKGE